MLQFLQVVVGFLLSLYLNQAHWSAAYAEMKARCDAAEAQSAAYQKDLQDARKEIKDLQDVVATSRKELQDEDVKVEKARDELRAALKKLEASDAALADARAAADKSQAAAKESGEGLLAAEKKNLELRKEVGSELVKEVDLQIQVHSLEQRAQELEKLNEKLTRDLAKPGADAPKRDAPNPPKDHVEGQIQEVDAKSGLVRITIGSDAGLAKGNSLEVYRLNDKDPTLSRYLGRIRIVEVAASDAIGQWVGKPTAPPQAGDMVSSDILGK